MQFGGGCTAEIISKDGLVLTNHHCGYGSIQKLSSVDHNYLLNGFWAKNREEEIPAPGLTVTFLDRFEDVTKEVTDALASATDATAKEDAFKKVSDKLASQAIGENKSLKAGSFHFTVTINTTSSLQKLIPTFVLLELRLRQSANLVLIPTTGCGRVIPATSACSGFTPEKTTILLNTPQTMSPINQRSF